MIDTLAYSALETTIKCVQNLSNILNGNYKIYIVYIMISQNQMHISYDITYHCCFFLFQKAIFLFFFSFDKLHYTTVKYTLCHAH